MVKPSLTFDNLRKLVVVYCNNAELGKISYGCTSVDINKCVVLPCREINTKNYVIFMPCFADVKPFQAILLIFNAILLINLQYFRSSNSGP